MLSVKTTISSDVGSGLRLGEDNYHTTPSALIDAKLMHFRASQLRQRSNPFMQCCHRMDEGLRDTQTGMPRGIPRGARCVQRFDDSLNSAIHITYRISLRSSSMREPRDPLLKVVYVYGLYIQVLLVKCKAVVLPQPKCTGVCDWIQRAARRRTVEESIMILPQVHLRKPCYDFYFL
jgi:hypothetical protein